MCFWWKFQNAVLLEGIFLPETNAIQFVVLDILSEIQHNTGMAFLLKGNVFRRKMYVENNITTPLLSSVKWLFSWPNLSIFKDGHLRALKVEFDLQSTAVQTQLIIFTAFAGCCPRDLQCVLIVEHPPRLCACVPEGNIDCFTFTVWCKS